MSLGIWEQRSKQQWLQLGDRNTKFFHKMASWRRIRNHITCVQDVDGNVLTEPKAIQAAFVDHFKKLFSPSGSLAEDALDTGLYPSHFNILNAMQCKLLSFPVELLKQPFTLNELQTAVFQMGKFKAPGPDGFIAGFYQKYWVEVGESVGDSVLSFLRSGFLSRALNKTFLCLIPKKESFNSD